MIKKYLLHFISFVVALSACFIPFNWLVGSYATFFSFSTITLPALGYHLSLFYVILAFLTKGLFVAPALKFFALRRLPLLAATIVLRKETFIGSVLIPLVCMALFCMHTVGGQVFYYSLYWLIPVALYAAPVDSLLSRSLQASFVAHAVGSVVWLYTKPIAPALWTALMPVVPVERILLALGMYSMVYVFGKILQFCKSKVYA